MNDADTARTVGRRRGHYVLPAVIVALTIAGAGAIGLGALDRPDRAPQESSVGGASRPGHAAVGPPAAAERRELTTGPLMDSSPPTRVRIPALDVTAPVIGLGALDRPGRASQESSAGGASRPGHAAVGPSAAAERRELTTGPLMASSPPTRVRIPALDVTAPVIGLGRQADGSMQVPTDATTVGWYTGAPTPGALGPAVLAGHVDYQKRPGTFADLIRLTPGDVIEVVRADASMAMFAVTRVEQYAKDRFPSTDVYGSIDHAGLRLITCGGDFDAAAGHYQDNIVVYAALRHAHPA